jgi:proline dehydrogenase
VLARDLLLRLSNQPALGRGLSRLPLTRDLVRRFVAGTRPEDALAVLADLDARGFHTAVTCLGENVHSPEAAQAAAGVYQGLLDEIHRRGLRCTPSLKLTHLGLDLGEDVARANAERVLAAARGTVVWLDMEDTRYTDRTLRLYQHLRVRWPGVAAVVQAYLFRTAADVRALVPGGLRVRLCKGAYREPPQRAFPAKRNVDRNYAHLAGMLLSREARAAGAYPAFATHDERLIRVISAEARKLGVPPDRYEFQMLYGIRPDLHEAVKADGQRVRILVPFGEDWYGYFVRRLAERPANVLFLLRGLRGGRPADRL